MHISDFHSLSFFPPPPLLITTGKSNKPIREFFGCVVDILCWKISAESVFVFLVSGQSSLTFNSPLSPFLHTFLYIVGVQGSAVYSSTHMHVHIYVNMHTCVHMYVHLHMHKSCTCTHACSHTYTHILLLSLPLLLCLSLPLSLSPPPSHPTV